MLNFSDVCAGLSCREGNLCAPDSNGERCVCVTGYSLSGVGNCVGEYLNFIFIIQSSIVCLGESIFQKYCCNYGLYILEITS